MPKQLTQYRVFIGSPGGLDDERKLFCDTLAKYTRLHSEPRDVIFHPVRWEETVGGAGRPQQQINEDLKQCDYAVFVLHDRWGSSTGDTYDSGFAEEWALAEELYKANKIRNIALFFRKVAPAQLHDPGEQLRRVLEFKDKVQSEKQYLFKQYDNVDEFTESLEAHLSRWFEDHEKTAPNLSLDALQMDDTPGNGADDAPPDLAPGFDYWIGEASRLLSNPAGGSVALFCATKAIDAAGSDIEWARATNLVGRAHLDLGNIDQAIETFASIASRFSNSSEPTNHFWHASALFNKGLSLGILDRSAEAIAVYDDLIARFGTVTEPPLREAVAKALFNKGVRLGELDRSTEEIAVYNDLIARFGAATEPTLREQVARALLNKGHALAKLDRSAEAIAVYDDLTARFGTVTEPALWEWIAKALFNKGLALAKLDRSAEAIAVYDDLTARFGTATEPALRERLAMALLSKGRNLGDLDRFAEAIAVYDDLIARFGTATELALREPLVLTLLSKGLSLGALDRPAEAIAVFDDLIARLGPATEPALREPLAMALLYKGLTLGHLDRPAEAIAVYDNLIARFGTATEPALRKLVEQARDWKKNIT